MAIKEKAGLIALVAGVLSFIGWIIPYIWFSQVGYSIMIWSWGLVTVTVTGLGPVPPAFVDEIIFAGVLILISAIILLATGALARKREDNKVLGIAMVVAAILGLIGVLVPLADPNISMIISITGGLSMGFYLPLLGAIIGIGAGAVAVEIKRTIVAEVSQPDVRIVEEKFPSEKAKFEFCPECGSKIEEPEIKVCGKCGFVLKPPEIAPL